VGEKQHWQKKDRRTLRTAWTQKPAC
jgi:hypothetical protein